MWLMAYAISIDSNQTVACDILLSKIYPAYPSDDAKITVIQYFFWISRNHFSTCLTLKVPVKVAADDFFPQENKT